MAENALRWQQLADEFCDFNGYAERTIMHNFAEWLAIKGITVSASPVRSEPSDAGICAYHFDTGVCVGPAGHKGLHVTSNATYPHGLFRGAAVQAPPDGLLGRLSGLSRTWDELAAYDKSIVAEARVSAAAAFQTCAEDLRAAVDRGVRPSPDGPWEVERGPRIPDVGSTSHYWLVSERRPLWRTAGFCYTEREAIAVRDALNALAAVPAGPSAGTRPKEEL